MRIFCPAMVVGRPSLPAAWYACPGGTCARSPRPAPAVGEPAGPCRWGLTRRRASGPRGRACRRVETYDTASQTRPRTPAPTRGPVVRGADVDPAHEVAVTYLHRAR